MTFQDYSYIFVITYARSGSTLLQSLLNTLDGVQIRGENNNALFHLYQSFSGIREARKFGLYGRESEPDEPWYGVGDLRPIKYRNALLNAFVNHVLRPMDGKSVLGFKEIRHVQFYMNDEQFSGYMRFLLNTFPNAKIIFNTRNAEDVAKSAWHARTDPSKIKALVANCDERFSSFDAKSKRTILMRYDDYVADHSRIAELFSFLGHPYDAATVEAVFAKPLSHAKLMPPPEENEDTV